MDRIKKITEALSRADETTLTAVEILLSLKAEPKKQPSFGKLSRKAKRYVLAMLQHPDCPAGVKERFKVVAAVNENAFASVSMMFEE